MTTRTFLNLTLGCLLGVAGCAEIDGKPSESDVKGGADGKAEAWGSADNPALFNSSLDYRIAELESEPLGQRYKGKFNPPTHLRQKLNITDINLDIEYLGTNLKVVMEVEKNKLFHFDKKQEFVFELARLRAASVHDLAQHWQIEIDKLMH